MVMSITIITITGIAMNDAATSRDILRLATWLSPAFPIGAYTYSSGLEYAVERGLVSDAPMLERWITDMIRFGMGRMEGGFFVLAHRAASTSGFEAFRDILAWSDAMRPTSELAFESESQGDAFLKTIRSAWPHEGLERMYTMSTESRRKPGYAVAVGAACGFHSVPLLAGLSAFLHAVAANLVSAAVRAIPLGQTDGQRVMSSLVVVIEEQAPTLVDIAREDLGAATPMVDWASMQHETQYTRLFRS